MVEGLQNLETRVDSVEHLVIKGVVDGDPLTIRHCNGDPLQRDDFIRGNRVSCPILVLLTEVYGGLFPPSHVSIFRGNFLCMLLKTRNRADSRICATVSVPPPLHLRIRDPILGFSPGDKNRQFPSRQSLSQSSARYIL
jgi:hypothetical protein